MAMEINFIINETYKIGNIRFIKLVILVYGISQIVRLITQKGSKL